ncbi:hypothetical protein ASC94_10130 [Massilia sp. Root418]|uniref:DUF1799 domain-containing protein n=1 Tax=Massilia sp. Root418 TaxID=1736532 RepID=UPI0006F39C08|nr:DUF1799 domain-containing protein [Massilia sp. Root418]KQW97139.1 hypothetical protein ASC94_10130 [Massilia sp. Root418]
MEQSGFAPEDFASEPVEIWPENLIAYSLFESLRTQWRNGPNGPTGLDYNVLYHKLDRMALPPEEYDQLEQDVCVMEVHAVSAMYQK